MLLVVDLDGTLADSRHREHHLQPRHEGDKPRWDAFFEDCDKDLVIVEVARIVQCMWVHGYKNVVMTGRPENVRLKTSMWLSDNGIPARELLMRADDDYRPSHELKRSLLVEHVLPRIAPKEKIVAIDNSEADCAMYRELGCIVMQVMVP